MLVMILLPGLSALLQSCGCDDKITYCHSVDSLSLTAFDNSGAARTEIKKGEVLSNAMVLQLKVGGQADVCASPISNAFNNNAVAFRKADCEIDKYIDEIESVSIVSNQRFDATHAAGENLKDLFVLPDDKVLNKEREHDLFLMHKPDDTATHIITVKLKFTNGKIAEATTEPIKLLR